MQKILLIGELEEIIRSLRLGMVLSDRSFCRQIM